MSDKPYAPSADNNKAPILTILKNYLKAHDTLLEIGSGTGQHICYFAHHFPDVIFQPSDLKNNLAGINTWITENALSNILSPLYINVTETGTHPDRHYDVIYSANTCHIMSMLEVETMFDLAGQRLKSKGYFILYGPFNENGQFTSDSNRLFDKQLKSQASHMGIRDKSTLNTVASHHMLAFQRSHVMPQNNQILVFQKI